MYIQLVSVKHYYNRSASGVVTAKQSLLGDLSASDDLTEVVNLV